LVLSWAYLLLIVLCCHCFVSLYLLMTVWCLLLSICFLWLCSLCLVIFSSLLVFVCFLFLVVLECLIIDLGSLCVKASKQFHFLDQCNPEQGFLWCVFASAINHNPLVFSCLWYSHVPWSGPSLLLSNCLLFFLLCR
jgi:hypothetical protein